MFTSLRNTAKYRSRENAWQKQYGPNAPQVGDVAPDFSLYDVTGEQAVTLSSFQGQKPVALIFGSFT